MKVTLRLSDRLYDELELLTPEGQTVETFIEKRLPLLERINPDRPHMYLNGDDLQALSMLFGSPIKDQKDLIDRLKRTQTLRFPGVLEVVLDIDIIQQLRQQAEGMCVPFEKYVRDNVNEALMFIVGVPIQNITLPH